MNKAVKNVLISEQDIDVKVKELGKEISAKFDGEELVVISILKARWFSLPI